MEYLYDLLRFYLLVVILDVFHFNFCAFILIFTLFLLIIFLENDLTPNPFLLDNLLQLELTEANPKFNKDKKKPILFSNIHDN